MEEGGVRSSFSWEGRLTFFEVQSAGFSSRRSGRVRPGQRARQKKHQPGDRTSTHPGPTGPAAHPQRCAHIARHYYAERSHHASSNLCRGGVDNSRSQLRPASTSYRRLASTKAYMSAARPVRLHQQPNQGFVADPSRSTAAAAAAAAASQQASSSSTPAAAEASPISTPPPHV